MSFPLQAAADAAAELRQRVRTLANERDQVAAQVGVRCALGIV